MTQSRMFFVGGCTAATFAIYFLYAFVLAPAILPARERAQAISMPREPLQDRELLKILFPSDSWVFDEANMISFSEGAGMLLFKESKVLEGNQVRVSPCVVLCFPSRSDTLSPQEKYRQAVVLEAANHALLELEGAFGFSSNLQLKGGQLNGIVTIRSQMKKPDLSDDIKVVTSDVLFDFNQIQTRQRVDFQFGPNKGYGRQLTIQMANTDESKKGQAPNTIKRIELRQLGELQLYVENRESKGSSVPTNRSHTLPQQPNAVWDNPMSLTWNSATSPSTTGLHQHVAAYPQTPHESDTFQLRAESAGTSVSTSPSDNASAPSSGAAQMGTQQMPFSLSGETQGAAAIETSNRTGAASRNATSTASANMSEVLILCKGIVDLTADPDTPSQWLLTFRNQVDVIRTNPQGGATDQLNCQELTVTFGPQPENITSDANHLAVTSAPASVNEAGKQEKNTNPLASFGALSPISVKAIGAPVIARSPETKGFQAVGREMTLDLVGKRLALTQGDEVSVLYDRFKVRGKSIYYDFSNENGLGELDMPGGGTLEGTTGSDASQNFKLEWSDELKVLQDKDDRDLTVVQIRGKPKAKLESIGTAAADEILIWCDTTKKQPGAGVSAAMLTASDEKMNANIKKMLMRKNVVLKTENGEMITNELEISFQQPNVTTATTATTRSTSRYPVPQAVGQTLRSDNGGSNALLSQMSFFGRDKDGNKSSYTVRADRVDVLAAVVDKKTIVEQILLTKNVNLDERASVAGEDPIHISGQTVRINKPDSQQLTVNIFGDGNVSGGHAVFQGAGVILMGANINIDRARNLFWVDGQGELRISQQAVTSSNGRNQGDSFSKLFATTGTAGGSKQTVVIDWGGSMEFDGKQLLFLKDVDINYTMMAINKSERVEVHLTKPFHFFEKDNPDEIEPERIVIRGNIDLERDTFAENNGGQQTHDCIRLTAVEIFPKTGIFKGLGPGYMTSIFQFKQGAAGNLLSGGANPVAAKGSSPTGAVAPEGAGLYGEGLKYIRCNFSGSVEGNYKTSQVAFHDRVVTMLCPAQSFRDIVNTNNTRNIVAKGMLLECNRLDITQFQQGGGSDAKSVDLKAEGNTLIEMTYDDRYYTATADKIKFEQAKNLITLEGNRSSEVVLYEAAHLNARAQKRAGGELIKLNPVTKEVRVDGLSGTFLLP